MFLSGKAPPCPMRFSSACLMLSGRRRSRRWDTGLARAAARLRARSRSVPEALDEPRQNLAQIRLLFQAAAVPQNLDESSAGAEGLDQVQRRLADPPGRIAQGL